MPRVVNITTAIPCAHDAHPAPKTPRRRGLFAAIATLLLGGAASAHLGGFEAADGYQPFLNMVQNYNAGEYGAVCSYGGGPMAITPNTGLWQALAGGFFSNNAVSYATGHFGRDRTYVNSGGAMGSSADQGLVLTTGHEGWNGPALKYKYDLDACDLGGCTPESTGNQVIKMSFWVCADLYGSGSPADIPDGYFGDEIAFLDSLGNVGFTIGLTQRASGDKVTYWNGATMVESTIVAASSRYDRWDITLDLASDTVSADYYSVGLNQTFTLVTNAPMMGTGMTNFTSMTFRTSPGVNNDKRMSVDDFTFEGCADCDAEVVEAVCALDGTGDISVTLQLTNNSGLDAHHVLITALPPGAPIGVSPNMINQIIPDGGTATVKVNFSGLMPGVEFCFVVTFLDESLQQCCSQTVCFTPDCDCFQVRNETEYLLCAPDGPPGTYLYTFQFDNLRPETIHHVFFFPPPGVTITPNYVAMVPPVAPYATSQPIMVMISGAMPGQELCFTVSIHDEFLNECCSREICIDLPICDDIERVGACCYEKAGLPQPVCVVTSQQDCLNQYHGVYMGDGSTCNPNPCIPDHGDDGTTTHLTAVSRCCWPQTQTATSTLTICNTSSIPRSYSWTLDSVAAPGCNNIIAPNFIIPNAGNVLVQPGQCVDIPITISCEGTLGQANTRSCLEANVTDLTSSAMYVSTGMVVSSVEAPGTSGQHFCIENPNPANAVPIPAGTYVVAQFPVTNSGDQDAVFSFGANAGGLLSIDGRDPGVGIDNFIAVRAGETVNVLFGVSFVEDRPLEYYDVILFSDLDGDGMAEPIISQAFVSRSGEPCQGDTNNDNHVDFFDLNTVLACFGATGDPEHLTGDLTRDGVVDFGDLNQVLGNFGRGCN